MLDANGGLFFEGLPWLGPTERRKLSPEAMASKVLCERHNGALSVIDAAGTPFFRCLLEIQRLQDSAPTSGPNACSHLANGHDIERWFLKILMGGLASDNVRHREVSTSNSQLPMDWLRFLFGETKALTQGGLYVLDPIDGVPITAHNMAFAPLARHGVIAGLLARLAGVQFGFIDGIRDEAPLLSGVFRPKELIVPTPSGARVIGISWEFPGDGKGAVLEWHRPAEAPSL